MKALSVAVCFIASTFVGVAHAENVYNMKHEGYLIKSQTDPGSPAIFDPIPISQISNDHLAFSGNAGLNWDDPFTFDQSTCCSVHLGNQGSFTVKFDRPVISAGIDIFPVDVDPIAAFEDLGNSTVSAVYRNSEGEIVGQSSVTANWLGSFETGEWQWNNTYNGHEGAFGVSNVAGFSEITFNVDGGESYFIAKGFSFIGPLSLGSTELYYSYHPIPEPETYAMMLAGLGMLSFTVKRRRKLAVNA